MTTTITRWIAIAKLLFTATAAIATVGLFNFVVDPLQLFGPSRYFSSYYSSDDRLQAAGLIQSQKFDAVFMGNSLATHFRASEISKHLGFHVVKLALGGSSSEEQHFVLKAALAKKPRLVLWQMDDWTFCGGPELEAYIPTDYYRRTVKGFASYLLSLGIAKESLAIAARSFNKTLEREIVLPLTWTGSLKFHEERADDLHAVPPYFDVHGTYNAKNALAAYEMHRSQPSGISFGYNFETMARNFERDAISLIEQNPDVKFRIYFTPYSILHFILKRNFAPWSLPITYRFSEYMMTRLLSFPNVTLTDFRDVAEITHNLDNYKDTIHHSPEVDAQILQRLERGENQVLRSDPLASLRRLEKQIADYPL
jgi:hypothetical protein